MGGLPIEPLKHCFFLLSSGSGLLYLKLTLREVVNSIRRNIDCMSRLELFESVSDGPAVLFSLPPTRLNQEPEEIR
jgi:hypothetical protein